MPPATRRKHLGMQDLGTGERCADTLKEFLAEAVRVCHHCCALRLVLFDEGNGLNQVVREK